MSIFGNKITKTRYCSKDYKTLPLHRTKKGQKPFTILIVCLIFLSQKTPAK